jgi:hypothetical protein
VEERVDQEVGGLRGSQLQHFLCGEVDEPAGGNPRPVRRSTPASVAIAAMLAEGSSASIRAPVPSTGARFRAASARTSENGVVGAAGEVGAERDVLARVELRPELIELRADPPVGVAAEHDPVPRPPGDDLVVHHLGGPDGGRRGTSPG